MEEIGSPWLCVGVISRKVLTMCDVTHTGKFFSYALLGGLVRVGAWGFGGARCLVARALKVFVVI